jgi:hypothetical protein
MYGVKVDPVCGVFETLEKAQEAINYLLKTYKDTIAYKQFEINEIELNKTYFD